MLHDYKPIDIKICDAEDFPDQNAKDVINDLKSDGLTPICMNNADLLELENSKKSKSY